MSCITACQPGSYSAWFELQYRNYRETSQQKLDSPSGTALLIAESIAEALSYDPVYSYGRHSSSNRRRAEEIGIHSIRGGTIIGDHEVLFAGNNELIEIKHSAQSRGVFANGALRAAEFIVDQKPGLYDMKNLVESVINK